MQEYEFNAHVEQAETKIHVRIYTIKNPLVVSVRIFPVGIHLAGDPVVFAISSVICFIPELKHESPIPWAVTVG